MLGFKSFKTATSILSGVEAMHMMKKGQLDFTGSSLSKIKRSSSINYLELLLKTTIPLGNFSPLYIFPKYLHQNHIYFCGVRRFTIKDII